MERVAQSYTDCQTAIAEITSALAEASTTLNDNYEGQADDLVAEMFAKLAEHLNLLDRCFEQMSAYVLNSLATIQAADTELGRTGQG
jgi:uncharacterized protein YukE